MNADYVMHLIKIAGKEQVTSEFPGGLSHQKNFEIIIYK